jgi:DNA modification methylase
LTAWPNRRGRAMSTPIVADYSEFLRSKAKTFQSSGLSVPDCEINQRLFPWQREVTRWAIRKGRAALFEGCGLGKTAQQLEWADQVRIAIGASILIIAPLAVAEQTHHEEAVKFGITTTLCQTQDDARPGLNITNYEMIKHFDPAWFRGVVLDESSILKSMDGATKQALIQMFRQTPYKLCCTATPAPNDYTELGNHAEFLGVMTRVEMLSMFFVHDGGDTGQWRLKGHAEQEFWKWVCSWAVVIRKPSDIGYSDEGYDLPPMERIQITIPADQPNEGYLIPMEASTLNERRGARRITIDARVEACADIVNRDPAQWIVWCGLNDESSALTAAIPDAIEVTGSDSREHKVRTMREFQAGKIRVIVTKLSIWGFGLNLQCCHKWFHVGISDSFEAMYQGDRRCWRFGQKEICECYIVTSELEGAVVRNIERKERDFEAMNEGMVEHMRDEMNREVHGATVTADEFETARTEGDGWIAILGDCVEELRKLEDDSIDYSVFSPPFAALYTYSASDRDMGNSDGREFMTHFSFAVKELARVLISGRLVSFHCMNLPTSKERDGFIGIKDFRGDLIRLFESHGFIFHSEVVIWKDPLVAASRTHALGLAHKQIVKDAAMTRMGIPDYVVTMRKPGDNPEPVTHKPRGFERYIGEDREPQRARSRSARENKYSHEVWQRYASPVWMDINPSDTLQRESAREEKDERHIAPLQLQVIRRCIELWTNPGDIVLSPFMGIGSEGYVAIQEGRCFIGIELKRSYYEQAWRNLTNAQAKQDGLFAQSAV